MPKKNVIIEEVPPEHHVLSGGYIREWILGANDGVVSVFTLVAGMTGAAVSNKIIIIAGLATVVGASISMGLGTYISTKSENEYYQQEIARERYEIEEMPDKERQELVEFYEKKGFKGKLLKQVVDTIFADKEVTLQEMLKEEIGVTEEDFKNPRLVGLFTSGAFVIGALPPILPYFFYTEAHPALVISAALSLAFVFTAGALRTLLTGKKWWKSGIEMVLVGVVAATITYYLGMLVGVSGLG